MYFLSGVYVNEEFVDIPLGQCLRVELKKSRVSFFDHDRFWDLTLGDDFSAVFVLESEAETRGIGLSDFLSLYSKREIYGFCNNFAPVMNKAFKEILVRLKNWRSLDKDQYYALTHPLEFKFEEDKLLVQECIVFNRDSFRGKVYGFYLDCPVLEFKKYYLKWSLLTNVLAG